MIVSRFNKRATFEIIGPAYCSKTGVRRKHWVWARRTDLDGTAIDYHLSAFVGTTDEDRLRLEGLGECQ